MCGPRQANNAYVQAVCLPSRTSAPGSLFTSGCSRRASARYARLISVSLAVRGTERASYSVRCAAGTAQIGASQGHVLRQPPWPMHVDVALHDATPRHAQSHGIQAHEPIACFTVIVQTQHYLNTIAVGTCSSCWLAWPHTCGPTKDGRLRTMRRYKNLRGMPPTQPAETA